MLIVPLMIAKNLPAGPIDLKANVSWLECKDVCIPANQDVEAKLNIGSETTSSADVTAIESWKSKVPKLASDSITLAYWHDPTNDNPRSLIIQTKPLKSGTADFFPDASEDFEIQSETKITSDEYSDSTIISKMVKKFSGDWPKKISGVLLF